MADSEVKIVTERTADAFAADLNRILSNGDWRIVATEIAVSNSFYFAMLVKAKRKPDGTRDV